MAKSLPARRPEVKVPYSFPQSQQHFFPNLVPAAVFLPPHPQETGWM